MLSTGTPETVAAWELDEHLAVVAGIAAVAAQFGCRQTAQFSLVKEFSLADNYKIHDYAVAATSGGLVADSSLFARPDRGHVISPFYRCGGLKLHAVEEMQQRYDEFAAGEYDRVYGGQRGGHVGEDGVVHTDPVPENPYKAKVSAR